MLFEMLFTSTILIIAIFCLRKMTLGKISMRLRYGLWLLVAVRLLVPLSAGTSAFSVMNLLPETISEQVQMFIDGGADGQRVPADTGRALTAGGGVDREFSDGQNTGAETAGGQPEAEKGSMRDDTAVDMVRTEEAPAGMKSGDSFSARSEALRGRKISALSRLLGLLWLAGFLAVGGYLLFCRRRFAGFLYGNRRELPAETVPEVFAKRLSERDMKVYRVKGLPGPCLVGRHIYIGEGASVQDRNLSHILAHEYCHAMHRDGFWAFLRCALTAVYWFDPFVWAAAYAARQDSELACDEAAVKLLGEASRFDYGRTLLALLEHAGSREKCPGMTFMTEGGERSVRERITALSKKSRTRGSVLAAVFAAVVLICGCAFTGAEREGANLSGELGEQETAGTNGNGQAGKDTAAVSGAQNRQQLNEGDNEEFARIQKEYEKTVKNAKLAEVQVGEVEKNALQEADRAAFEEALNYHGVMEGKDDSELSLNRQVDCQAYYQYTKGEAENPMENGWYLLCENRDAGISLYGLYTEEFGFRGLKTLIGEDVNTFDGRWCVSLVNSMDDNIRVLEQTEDGLPRRFVWKLLAEESGTVEIWRFYYANRYDTGTVDMKMLSEEGCLAWAKKYLTFDVDKEAKELLVTYDGDMYLGAIDISAYQDFETEDVQIVPDAVAFMLDDPGADMYQAYSDTVWEKTAVHLMVGLKFKGIEGLWFDGLPILTVQVAEDEKSASGFQLGHPRIDETYVASAPWQEKKISKLREGTASSQAGDSDSAGAGRNDLEKPLLNGAEGHHDVAITFSNPCPAFDRISDGFGERTHPVTGEVRTHTGVDMAAPEGADILAAADGTVSMTGFDTVNGNYVVLWHGQSGQMTYYTHCKTIAVEKGQQVARGEIIATVGKTGQATGPFLHFAVSSGTNWEEPHWEELGD